MATEKVRKKPSTFVAIKPFPPGNVKNTLVVPESLAPRVSGHEGTALMSPSIPRVIMQTGPTRTLLDTFALAIHSMLEMNPEFQYEFYDNDRCIEFLREHFSPEIEEVFHALIPGAYKSDLFRLCYLYIKGGVYVDINKTIILPLGESLVTPESVFYSAVDTVPHFIFQAFLVAQPKLEFLWTAILRIQHNVEHRYYGLCCLCPTGPGMLGKSVFHKEYRFAATRPGNFLLANRWPITLFSFDSFHIQDLQGNNFVDTFNPEAHPDVKYHQQRLYKHDHYSQSYHNRTCFAETPTSQAIQASLNRNSWILILLLAVGGLSWLAFIMYKVAQSRPT